MHGNSGCARRWRGEVMNDNTAERGAGATMTETEVKEFQDRLEDELVEADTHAAATNVLLRAIIELLLKEANR